MNLPQRLEEIKGEWREYNTTLILKDLKITEEGTADWWTSHFSTLLNEIVDEIVPEENNNFEYHGESNASIFQDGFHACLSTIKANLERLQAKEK